ncbi:hypothetical protein [Lewinella sp. IMCC34183]|uniref:hypothetical protein n=1 Tax=Lewinella sp. IMCC34183 TaxID=2248762 RepID=UPI001300B25E|nr:hypothetical protein [Lewinella sp. IMCC34183]
MSLYLQSNELSEDVWWILGALIVLAVVFYLTKRAQNTQRAKEVKTNDPRQNVVNDTSYNINQDGIDGHRSENMSPDEARRTIDDMKETGHIASDEEFRDLNDDLRKEK